MWKLTGNETASDAAAWLIGKPLAILGLVVIGLVGRWVLHRMIDRVVAAPRTACCPAGSAR